MTLAQLRTRTLQRLDEDTTSPVYWSAQEIHAALNEAQRVFVFLTLCLEKTGTLALSAATTFYHLRSTFSDFLLPLRVRVASTGAKVHPARLQELDALDSTWPSSAGTPVRYACLGFDFFAVYKQPAAPGTSLDVTYAHTPATLAADGDTPEIPTEHHLTLIDYAIPRLRAKEGGQEFVKTLPLFGQFLDAASKMAAYVRARSLEARYDRLPFELSSYDRSRLIDPNQYMRFLKPWLVERRPEKQQPALVA